MFFLSFLCLVEICVQVCCEQGICELYLGLDSSCGLLCDCWWPHFQFLLCGMTLSSRTPPEPKLTVRCPQSASSSVCMCLFEWGSLSVVHILSLSCELLMRCVSECEDATAGVYWQLIVIKNRMSNVPVCRTLSKTWHAPTLMAHPVCEEVVSWGETSHLCVFESCDQRFCRLASCKSLVRNEYTVVWKKC